MLLGELYSLNKEYWLEPPMDDTIGAEKVREYGLTDNQFRFAEAVAEMMDGTHPEFTAFDFGEVAPEEIQSATTAADYLDELR